MSGPSRESWIWATLGVVLLAVVAAGAWSLLVSGPQAAPELPVLGEVPAFSLIERSGDELTEAELRGTPWVADFIFTQCSGVCPILSQRMRELQRAATDRGVAARFVSFSVDPTRDTPQALRAYADRFRAAPGWFFVTGDRRQLYRLVGEGFRLSVAERDPEEAAADSGELITHSDRFVLVDGELRIRGYYHGTADDVVEQLLDDLAKLGAQRRPSEPLAAHGSKSTNGSAATPIGAASGARGQIHKRKRSDAHRSR